MSERSFEDRLQDLIEQFESVDAVADTETSSEMLNPQTHVIGSLGDNHQFVGDARRFVQVDLTMVTGEVRTCKLYKQQKTQLNGAMVGASAMIDLPEKQIIDFYEMNQEYEIKFAKVVFPMKRGGDG